MKKCVSVIAASALFLTTAGAAEIPKVETFLGYTYVRVNSAGNIDAFNANGGSGQFIYNFDKWISGVVDVGAVHNGDIGGFQIDNTGVNFLAGPRFSIGKGSRITPYVQALFGGVYYTASSRIDGIETATAFLPGIQAPTFPTPGQPITTRLTTSQTDFAMTAGGGLELKLNRHVRFRPIGLDYYMTRIKNLRIPGDHQQNNLRYSTGLTFTFGGEQPTPPAPPAPVTKTCWNGMAVPLNSPCPKHDLTLSLAATSVEVCSGETVQISPAIGGGDRNQLTYQWSVNGQPVSKGQTFSFGTADRQPGSYNITLTAGGVDFNSASASKTITVREYRPPTGTVQANPAQIYAGEKSTLSASFQGQCGGEIKAPTFTADQGSVQGDQFDSTGVLFDPANKAEQRKTVTITATAADNRSSGTATTSVDVIQKATIAAIRLPDVLFSPNDSRVNNCGKRVLLEELRSYIQRDPTGTVVLVGHTSSDETAAGLDMKRALNAAAVITAGTGICLSIPKTQVWVNATGVDQNGVGFESGFCGPSVKAGSSSAASMRRVEVWFVPTGGQPPASLTAHQDASALPVSELGCPK